MRLLLILLTALCAWAQIGPSFPGPGNSSLSMPSGALGIWYADQYASSPRKYIPNAVSPVTPVSKWDATRGAFGNTLFWANIHSVTVTDLNATAPDASTGASTVVGTATDWFLGRTPSSVPAGTYTTGLYVKSADANSYSFKLGLGITSNTYTATTAWQRFTTSNTTGSTGNLQAILQANGTTASLQICDWELFSGPSDLGPETIAGTMTVGLTAWDSRPSASGGILDLSPSGAFAHIQMPSSTVLSSGFTVVSVAEQTAASSTYVCVLCAPNLNWTAFGADLQLPVSGVAPMVGYTGNVTWTPGSTTDYWKFLNTGWHTFAHQYNGTQTMFWMDGGQRLYVAGSRTNPTVRDFMVGTIWNEGYGQGWKFNAIAYFPRALSASEIRTAEAVLLARASAYAIRPSSGPRWVVAEGDSITATTANYPAIAGSSLSPAAFGIITAGTGSSLTAVASRAPNEDQGVPSVRPSGAKHIISLLIGRNDFGSYSASDYAAAISSWALARKAAGWDKVVLCTILPATATGYNTWRNAVNTIITGAGWAVANGVDAIADFASDPTMGCDACAANATYYSDGTHPTTAGQTILAGIWGPVINAQ